MKNTRSHDETPAGRSEQLSSWNAKQPTLAFVVVALVLGWFLLVASAPWSNVASVFGAMATMAAGLVLLGVGQSLLVIFAHPHWTRAQANGSLLAFPIGLIAVCGVAQAFHNQGLSTAAVIVTCCSLAMPGLFLAARSFLRIAGNRVEYGYAYIFVVLIASAMHYVPMSRTESIIHGDSSISWNSPDASYFEALTGLLAREPRPLRNPGVGLQIAAYHYGRLVLANAISQLFGLRVGDSLNRGMHILGLIGLLLATIGLGRNVGRNEQERPLSGLLAVVLVFLLPSFLAWLKLTGVYAYDVHLGSGDKTFYHILNGWSALWGGLIAIVVAAILIQPQGDACDRPARLPWLALSIALLGITVNGVAGACCIGIVVALPLVEDWKNWRNIPFFLLAIFLFYGFRFVVGLNHIPQEGFFSLGVGLLAVARLCDAGFFLLFSFHALAIVCYMLNSRRVAVVLTLAVFVFCAIFIAFDFQAYPIWFLHMLLSGLAAGPMAALVYAGFARGDAWGELWITTIRGFRNYLGLLVLASSIILPITSYLLVRHLAPSLLGSKSSEFYAPSIEVPLVLVAALLLRFAAGRTVANRWIPSRGLVGVLTVGLILLSLAGAERHVANTFVPGVELDSGHVASLQYLYNNTAADSLLATTKHVFDIPRHPEDADSYVYAAVAQRYFFLEGWKFSSAPLSSPSIFENIQRANGELFSTHSAAEAHSIVEHFGITHILLEPGETLGFASKDAPWLHILPNPGTMTILKVDSDASFVPASKQLF